MHEKSLRLLVNPAAARGRAVRRLPRLLAHFRQAGLDPAVWLSDGPGDIEAEARRFASDPANAGALLLVAGGDGSVHEAVNGLLAAGGSQPLGVLPVGTGNDFAKAAAIPLDWPTAARLLADRVANDVPPRRIDAGRMNGRWFANGAGIGFDATVARVADSYRSPMGGLVYPLALLRTLAGGVTTPGMRITTDGVLWDGPLTLANVANGRWVGGMFPIAPMADHADGVLDLVIAAPVNRRRVLALLPQLLRGTHMTAPEVRHWPVEKLVVEAEAPVAWHLDGEVQPLAARFDIEIVPRALSLL